MKSEYLLWHYEIPEAVLDNLRRGLANLFQQTHLEKPNFLAEFPYILGKTLDIHTRQFEIKAERE
eukprot:1374555-Amorphochlora_amoeboformis.AAC.1